MNKKRIKVVIIRSTINLFLILFGFALIAAFGPYIKYDLIYKINVAEGHTYTVSNKPATSDSNNQQVLGGIVGPSTIQLNPVSTDYSIVIPKLNINEKIIDNVNPNNDSLVKSALRNGVGHAAGTANPGQLGNVYLFAHSSADVLYIALYNSVFTLLRELNPGDEVVVFYKGKRYNYIVYTKYVVSPQDTKDLTYYADQPTLTLQTCDPPGLDINRLLVKAHLAGVGS